MAVPRGVGENDRVGTWDEPAWKGEPAVAAYAARVRRGLRYMVGSAATATLAWVALVGLGGVFLSWLVVIGILAFPEVVLLLRRLAGMERRRAAAMLGTPIPEQYAPLYDTERQRSRLRRALTDPATWRDLAWLVAHAVAGIAPAVAVVTALPSPWWFLLTLAVIVFGAPWIAWLQASLARLLLKPSSRARLAARVEELSATRADALDAHGAELRRIERDLHDGAQARLVSVGLQLGIAEQKLGADPQAAARLVGEARDGANEALTELREVVRGIHPPILSDRGLAGAVSALVANTPVPVTVVSEETGRLPAAVESAAYFVVTEALTNMARHSGAARGDVHVVREGGTLVVEVRDDGHGGADESRGSGLAGIRRRVAAFDGHTTVTSPAGGPTVLRVEIPCGS